MFERKMSHLPSRVKNDVRLQAVVVRLHVDQPLGAQRAGMHEVAGVRRGDSGDVRNRLRA